MLYITRAIINTIQYTTTLVVVYWIVSVVTYIAQSNIPRQGEVEGWGRDPKICTGRHWGMGSSTI